MKRRLVFGSAAGVFVVVHGEETPSDPEWDAWMSYWADLTYKQVGRMRQLVVSAGGAPTAAQRHRMMERFRVEQQRWAELWAARGKSPPEAGRVAIVSESAFVRGVVNALDALVSEQRFTGKLYRAFVRPIASTQAYRAFPQREMPRALAWLDVPNGIEPELLRKVEELKKELSKG